MQAFDPQAFKESYEHDGWIEPDQLRNITNIGDLLLSDWDQELRKLRE